MTPWIPVGASRLRPLMCPSELSGLLSELVRQAELVIPNGSFNSSYDPVDSVSLPQVSLYHSLFLLILGLWMIMVS